MEFLKGKHLEDRLQGRDALIGSIKLRLKDSDEKIFAFNEVINYCAESKLCAEDDTLKRNHELVITLEDGILNGGFGEKVARFYGPSDMKVYCLGGEKEFTDRVPANELYNRYRLTKEQITEDVRKILHL